MTATGLGPGTELPTRTVTAVDSEHILQVALLLRDPNPIHFDVAAVAAAGLGDRPVNQGGASMAYVIDMLTSWSGSRSSLSEIRCRFRANVFAGDDVTSGATVAAVEECTDHRLIRCDVWARRGDGTLVIDGQATLRVPR